MSGGGTGAAVGRVETRAGVDVWQVDLDAPPAIDPAALPVADRERIARLRPPGRARWLAARAALRWVLAGYLGQSPGRIELTLGRHGKPALAGHRARLRFNLAHSSNLALVAVATGREVGIDLEAKVGGRDFLRLAEVGLGTDAAAAVRDAPAEARADVFYAAWVRHEATVKCAGSGLTGPCPRGPMSVRDLDVGDGYAAALAVAD